MTYIGLKAAYMTGGLRMDCRVAELRCKEIIDIADGTRYGYVGDVEVDVETGQVRSLVVYGKLRLFGLFGREEDRVFRWSSVRRFGEDIILVEGMNERGERSAAGRMERKRRK